MYQKEFSTTAKLASFVISSIIFSSLLVGLGGIIYLYTLSNSKEYSSEKSQFGELFEGLRPAKMAHLFHVLFLVRRVLSATWIVFTEKMLIEIRVAVFVMIQVLQLIYLAVVRPFESLKDNIIEIVNDFVYCII